MASHMAVQNMASERNSNVESFVHFLLTEFTDKLAAAGKLSRVEVKPQKLYTSAIASDVWDHLITGQQASGRAFEVWGQTTCYKGHVSGKTESNKTYEIRETLVEALSLRDRFLENSDVDGRSLHITVGNKNYTYQWFEDLKAATFDKSIYIDGSDFDIFSEISKAIGHLVTEKEKSAALMELKGSDAHLGKAIRKALAELEDWYCENDFRKSEWADKQFALVAAKVSGSGSVLLRSIPAGANIKGRVNSVIFDENYVDPDKLIAETAVKMLSKNPFLQCAVDTVTNWEKFCTDISRVAKQSPNLHEFVRSLWALPSPQHLVVRRLLLRIHTADALAYVQDREIEGIGEHNLYGGDHSERQTEEICGQIVKSLADNGIHQTAQLLERICKNGKHLVNQARWFESRNGTKVKPSFDYVELVLKQAGYTVETPFDANIRLVGYHAELTKEKVKPYTNFRIVKNSSGRILGILKAKYFRVQEFPRRCKEEAFVGLSLKNSVENGKFAQRFKFPLIMFVDMPENCSPPVYSCKRLEYFGWDMVFSVDELLGKLKDA